MCVFNNYADDSDSLVESETEFETSNPSISTLQGNQNSVGSSRIYKTGGSSFSQMNAQSELSSDNSNSENESQTGDNVGTSGAPDNLSCFNEQQSDHSNSIDIQHTKAQLTLGINKLVVMTMVSIHQTLKC